MFPQSTQPLAQLASLGRSRSKQVRKPRRKWQGRSGRQAIAALYPLHAWWRLAQHPLCMQVFPFCALQLTFQVTDCLFSLFNNLSANSADICFSWSLSARILISYSSLPSKPSGSIQAVWSAYLFLCRGLTCLAGSSVSLPQSSP